MKIPCTIMRGGTSKGVFLRATDLPPPGLARDQTLLRIFGSPDRRQIDGLGGADPLTSKVAIIGEPSRKNADIDYTFGQVGIETGYVDYGGYCGNILAGVAAYAVDEGFVKASADTVEVRVNVTNTGRIVYARVPARDGRFQPKGDLGIAGVPGTGAPILLNFAKTVGSVSGRVLPTGRPVDTIELDGMGRVEISLVDVANPMIFVRMSDFGVAAALGPDQLDPRRDLIERIELIRRQVARQFKITMPDGSISENIPLVALVGLPEEYVAYGSNAAVGASEVDFISREFFAGRLHKAYGIGETVCTVAAALTQGTLVHQAAREPRISARHVSFGHPSGALRVEVEADTSEIEPIFKAIIVARTARRILDGFVYLDEFRN
jgi:2-methylaconitate cis-trans-isomerase PrpF